MLVKFLLFISISFSGKTYYYKLENGLRVVFVQNKSLPVFFGMIQFDVGSANEAPGITGTSHLLEHMLFKGSKKLGTINYKNEVKINEKIEKLYERLEAEKDSIKKLVIKDSIFALQEELKKYVISEEIWKIYNMHGGSMMNAMTSSVSTSYFVMLPSNKKELWTKIESDRFQNLVLREFFSERDVVNEERRLDEGNPYNKIWDELLSTAYKASPVRWPVIGWEDDIMHVTPKQVMWYYKTHYTPDNCIIVLVGDVDPEKDLKLIKKYFGNWKGKAERIFKYTDEPEQKEVRRVEIKSKGMPTFVVGFKGPKYPEKDYYALSLFSYMFGEAEGSLIKREFTKEGLILDGESFTMSWDGKAPSLFGIYLIPKKNTDFTELENKIFAYIDSIKNNKLDEKLLTKAKNHYKMSAIMRQKGHMYVAFTASRGVRVADDPNFFEKELEMVDSITLDDIYRVINLYLTKEKATIVTLGR
ncbi:MAG: M16 family metallopeptidase [Candidatus Hydrothermia bacterium]